MLLQKRNKKDTGLIPFNSLHSFDEDSDTWESLNVKNGLGESLLCRDDITSSVEYFIKNFIDVGNVEKYEVDPKILFFVSNEGDMNNINMELISKVKNEEFNPFTKHAQINDLDYKVIPFYNTNMVYTELKVNSGDRSKSLYESYRYILTQFFKNIDLIYDDIVDVTEKTAKLIKERMKVHATKSEELLGEDSKSIMTNIHIANLKTTIGKVDSYRSLPLHKHTVNLGNHSRSYMWTYRVSNHSSNPNLYRYLIVDTSHKKSCAYFELIGTNVVDQFITNAFDTMAPFGNRNVGYILLRGGSNYTLLTNDPNANFANTGIGAVNRSSAFIDSATGGLFRSGNDLVMESLTDLFNVALKHSNGRYYRLEI